jgi:hypothetical protein
MEGKVIGDVRDILFGRGEKESNFKRFPRLLLPVSIREV